MEFLKRHAGLLIVLAVFVLWMVIIGLRARGLIAAADLRDAVAKDIPTAEKLIKEERADEEHFAEDTPRDHVEGVWRAGPAARAPRYRSTLLGEPKKAIAEP